MHEKWLKCTLLKGMFSSEAVVETSGGMSFFVNEDQIRRDNEHRGKVRVRVFEREGSWWAILPTESVDVIEIHNDELEGITA